MPSLALLRAQIALCRHVELDRQMERASPSTDAPTRARTSPALHRVRLAPGHALEHAAVKHVAESACDAVKDVSALIRNECIRTGPRENIVHMDLRRLMDPRVYKSKVTSSQFHDDPFGSDGESRFCSARIAAVIEPIEVEDEKPIVSVSSQRPT
jgi:hypothetical protein